MLGCQLCEEVSHLGLLYFLFRARLRTVFELSHSGLQAIPDGTASKKKMLSTLQRARFVSWLVIANQAFIHVVYLAMPFLFTVFGNDRYLPTTPGETFGKTTLLHHDFIGSYSYRYRMGFSIATCNKLFSKQFYFCCI